MAKMTAHRTANPGTVTLDFDVPASLLTADEFAPIRALRAAYDDAQAAVAAAMENLDEAKDAPQTREAAILRAVRDGKRVPPAISEPEAQALVKVANERVNDALRAAKRAADAYEASFVEHRVALRESLAPAFKAADEEAAELARSAASAKARRDLILTAFNTLDHAAAFAADNAATGGRTHHHTAAVASARGRLPETAAVDSDLLTTDEYLLAKHGGEVVREVGAIREALRKIRDHEWNHLSAERLNKIVTTHEARLRSLGLAP